MANVYLAGTGRKTTGSLLAAVKVLRRDQSSDEYVRRLFRLEIEALIELNASGTLRLLDCDPDHDSPWFATEYFPSLDLRSLVSIHGPLETMAVLRLAAEIASILIRLKTHNIVHRDLKPSNILVLSAADGSLRLIDFGVARKLDRTKTNPAMTVGTDAYMAPEQQYGEAGHPSDMFALGLTLAYAASGVQAPRPDLHQGRLGRPARFPDDAFDGLAGSLRELVVECTRADPEDRITARDLLHRLARIGVRPRKEATGSATWLSNTARAQVLQHAERSRAFIPGRPTRPLTAAPAEPEVRWVHELSGRAYFTSPVDVGHGIAVCSLDGSVRLLDARDGTPTWKRDLAARIESTPAAGHGMLFVPCSDRTLLALDTRDGSTRWTYPAGDNALFAPVVRGDRVLAGARDGAIHCISVHTGAPLWISDRGHGPVFDRPVVAADRGYASGWQGSLQALALDTGDSAEALPQLRDIVGAPALDRDTLFLADRTGSLYAIDARTAQERWRHERRTAACTGPVVVRDLVCLGTAGGTVWAHDARTGALKWQLTTSGRLRCVPVPYDGGLYVSVDDVLTAVDARTGAVRWTHRAPGTVHAPPLIARGHAYIGTWNRTVEALRIPDPSSSPTDLLPPRPHPRENENGPVRDASGFGRTPWSG
ncbi:PQQ-binding-like beta-propeller repeat protein [Streptomyces mangrovisoli]|nr:serine/threonine-protein kinase [Streptomyces mangrovisoli]